MKLLTDIVKLIASIAVIIGIGLAIITLYPQPEEKSLEVPESQADVWDLNMFEKTHTQKFASALENLGHEPPRVYEQNGNTVYFSTRTSLDKPNELLLEYQEEFVKQGLNKKIRTTTPQAASELPIESQQEFIDDYFGAVRQGEIVPVHKIQDSYMSMTGGLLKGAPTSPAAIQAGFREMIADGSDDVVASLRLAFKHCGGSEADYQRVLEERRASVTAQGGCAAWDPTCSPEISKERELAIELATFRAAIEEQGYEKCPAYGEAMQEFSAKYSVDGQLSAIRSIEAFRDPSDQGSAVTAVWSDDDYDMKKNLPHKYGPSQGSYSPDVPLCPDCTPTWNLLGSGDETKYGTSMMVSFHPLDDVEAFYTKRMADEGWQVTEGGAVMSTVMNRVGNPAPQHRSMKLRKGPHELHLHMMWNEALSKTTVTVARGSKNPYETQGATR